MTAQRISRLVFWLDGVMVSRRPESRLQPGMADLLDELKDKFELWLVSDYLAGETAAVMSRNVLYRWFADATVHVLPGGISSHQELLESLVTSGIIVPGSSLWIDDHPKLTMLALRRGIDASVFVDAKRLRRDLALWGIVPFNS